MDRPITSVPGMENYLRCRDLPSCCRATDMEDPFIKLVVKQTRNSLQANALLNTRLKAKHGESYHPFLNTLWEVDRKCISWLDQQPNRCVIYAEFRDRERCRRGGYVEGAFREDQGSRLHCQLGTARGGLEPSGHRRQHLNSRVVSEVWKIGLDMKDVCHRKIVEKMVKDVMVDRKEEFAKSAAEMAKLTNQCVNVGGSSYINLDRLIEAIREMSLNSSSFARYKTSIGHDFLGVSVVGGDKVGCSFIDGKGRLSAWV
ncbi:hypothetical protein F3Y22_tig00001695pilonHSYRG00016 [Hibiscus syriacus]|uniref:Uncharacterized protein n=1 Tax=Hibiscus syriacus TaxID=106335 RepID=A0A6A3D0C3_HIBSY|nr:hypothetical protein F3Y22_tig00001695pilonHSYRG00016 [Hibiscus syriacus]